MATTTEASHTAELAKQAYEDSARWFPDNPMATAIPHMVLGLCGEVGELANLIKKIERGDLSWEDPAVRWQVVSELADVYTYTLITSVLAGIDLEKAYERKRVENEQRWGKPASDSGTRDGDKRPLRSVDGGKRTDGS